MHSDKSPYHPSSQHGFRPFNFSKLTLHPNKKVSSNSFSDRISRGASHSFNDKESYSRTPTKTHQSIRVTRMLVLVSTCFLLLNAPAHLCVITLKIYASINVPVFNEDSDLNLPHQINNSTDFELTKFSSRIDFYNRSRNEISLSSIQHERILEDQITIHLFYIAILVTQSIAYASYSINFFLYSLSGIAFRTSLRQVLDKCRKN